MCGADTVVRPLLTLMLQSLLHRVVSSGPSISVKVTIKTKLKSKSESSAADKSVRPTLTLFFGFVVVQDFGDDVVDDFVDAFVGQIEVVRQDGKRNHLTVIRRGVS